MTTVNEHLDAVMAVMVGHYQRMTGEGQRWMKLAIENLEEAQTRYNGAHYHDRGTFHRADPDKADDNQPLAGQTAITDEVTA